MDSGAGANTGADLGAGADTGADSGERIGAENFSGLESAAAGELD